MADPVKVRLTPLERFTLIRSLPAKGDIQKVETARQLAMKVVLDIEEAKPLEGLPISDAEQVGEEKEFEFSPFENNLIINTLTEMNDKKELTQLHVTLYRKFCQ